jgi:hypothetical protein
VLSTPMHWLPTTSRDCCWPGQRVKTTPGGGASAMSSYQD